VKSRADLATHKKRLQLLAREILGLPDPLPIPDVEVRASRTRAGLKLTPVVLTPENGILLPGVWIEAGDFRAKDARRPAILYLDDRGKSTLARDDELVRALVAKGYRLFAADLRGTGETTPGMEGKFWDFLAGRTIFAQRVADVLAILKWLGQPAVEPEGIYVWGRGMSAVHAALAALLDDSARGVRGCVLDEPPLSFESAVSVKVPAYRHEILLPGVLEKFDLPQVYQALCPARVLLLNPLRGDRAPASGEAAERIFRPVADTYRAIGLSHHWRLCTGITRTEKPQILLTPERSPLYH
jgi:pimeloyl-ACP methyl ester carboxylesterase